ncbi:hypothetical protein KXD98_24255 [Mycobacterium sp. SMC-4]|nr:hypothetical protein KXD98_24255 [Mycobacterium sp. SMC-4]
MSMSGFQRGWFFLFLVVIAGLVALYLVAARHRHRRMLRFANMELLDR